MEIFVKASSVGYGFPAIGVCNLHFREVAVPIQIHRDGTVLEGQITFVAQVTDDQAERIAKELMEFVKQTRHARSIEKAEKGDSL